MRVTSGSWRWWVLGGLALGRHPNGRRRASTTRERLEPLARLGCLEQAEGDSRGEAVSAESMGKAGGYADREFQKRRGDYLRSNRVLRSSLASLYALLTVAGVVLVWPTMWRMWLGVAAVFVGSQALALYSSITVDLPDWVANWRRGAEGERFTEAELSALPSGWTVRHDLDDKDVEGLRGNVDHVVVGPGGAFAIDSKRWAGEAVSVADGNVSITRVRSGRSSRNGNRHLGAVKGQALAVSRTIKSRGRVTRWVTPVVAVWADSCPGATEVDGYWLVPGPDLREWLLARPVVMSEREAGLIAQAFGIAKP